MQECRFNASKQSRGKRLNGSELRTTFEEIDTPWKLLEFLSVTGPFQEKASPGLQIAQVIRWTEFLEWQQFMRDLQEQKLSKESDLVDGPVARDLAFQVGDLSIVHIAPPVRWAPGPFFECFANTTLQFIASSIAVDILNQTKWRVCDRDECERLFPVFSKHNSREHGYCSDRCRKLQYQADTRPPKKRKVSGVPQRRRTELRSVSESHQ